MKQETINRDGGILIITGEASGDNYAAMVISEIKKCKPEREILAVGGDKSYEAGAKLIAHYSSISVLGLLEVAGKLPKIISLLQKIKCLIREGSIETLLLIDFPDFNFRVGKYARRRGIRVVYYIPPQMWAWREGRVAVVDEMSDYIVVPFPFEVDFFGDRGVKAHFYGHPLVEMIRKSGKNPAGTTGESEGASKKEGITLALFPGSRETEVVRLLPLQLESARILKDIHEDIQFVLPLAHRHLKELVRSFIKRSGVNVELIETKPPSLHDRIDLAIASSGTVTLELAINGVPTVVIYRVSPVTYLVGRGLVKVDSIALPNILLKKKIFPELIQGDATPRNIVKEVERFVMDDKLRDNVRDEGKIILGMLEGCGPAKKVAEYICGQGVR